MTTVASVLSDMRYDLRDWGAIEYDDTSLIKFLNRAIHLLNHELIQIDSHWTLESDDVTLSTSSNSVSVPTGCDTVRQVWYSNDLLEKKTPHWIFSYRESIGRTSTGTPNYWAQHQDTILVEYVADADYTLRVIYNKAAVDVTSGGDMPYSGIYDDQLRQGTLIIARAAKDKQIVDVEAQVQQLFKRILERDAVKVLHTKPRYHLDF